MECNNTIAAISSNCGVGVLATLGIDLTVPLVTVAGGDILICILYWVDCEVESSNAIAAVDSRENDTILAFSGVGLTVPSVGFAVADSGVFGCTHF